MLTPWARAIEAPSWPTLQAFAGQRDGEAVLSSFGRIRTTATSARQVQLGARVVF
jgi:hypothetical protein